MRTLALTIAALSFLICQTQAEEAKPLLTFVLAGQSNMVGKRCVVEELPERLRGPIANAQFFAADSKKWIPLEAGKTQPQGFGPEIAFGAAVAELLDQPIGIIKHSVGGTNLAVQWDPERPQSLYARLAAMVEDAGKARPIQVAGMLWVQGGADAKSEAQANAYADNLREMIEHSRERFSNPDMPFLSGRIPAKNSKQKPHWPVVRAAQQNLQMANYRWVDCDSISLGPDKVHYDTAGMMTLGEAQARIVAEMLGVSKPE